MDNCLPVGKLTSSCITVHKVAHVYSGYKYTISTVLFRLIKVKDSTKINVLIRLFYSFFNLPTLETTTVF